MVAVAARAPLPRIRLGYHAAGAHRPSPSDRPRLASQRDLHDGYQGYAEKTAMDNGLVAKGMAMLTKPFDVAHLVHKVRQMLDGVR